MHGNRNIATRAKDVVSAYLSLTKALENLSDRLGLAHTQEDFGTLTNQEISSKGWWSPEVTPPLYAVAPLNSTRDQFLHRSVCLFKFLELLKPGPLRTVACQLGIKKGEIIDFKSLKLLACICQLAKIAQDQGLSLSEDSDVVSPQWNKKEELPELSSLFALNRLRDCQSHTPGSEREVKIQSAAGSFGIDIVATSSGWGYAIDRLYDRLAEDLSSIAKLIEDVI